MISADDVRRMAELQGLSIPDAQLLRVVALLQRIEEVAGRLDEVKLDPFTDEPAPIWRP